MQVAGAAFFSAWAVMITAQLSVRSIFSPLLFFALFWLYRKTMQRKDSRRVSVCVRVLAFMLTLCTVLVRILPVSSDFDSTLFRVLTILIAATGLYLLFCTVLNAVTAPSADSCIRKICFSSDTGSSTPASVFFSKHTLSLSFGICFLCRLPWWFYGYPGILSPDSIDQLMQATGRIPLQNAHPAFHTLFLRLCLRLAEGFGADINGGVALYTLLQMTFLCFCAACAVSTLHHTARLRPLICAVFLGAYALFPFHSVFALYMTKDSVFAGCLTLLCCNLYTMVTESVASSGIRKTTALRFALLTLLTSLSRSNAYAAFLLPVLFLLLFFRKQYKRLLPAVLLFFLVSLILHRLVLSSLQIPSSDLIEKWNLPLQQVARVLVDEKDISEEDHALIESCIGQRDVKLWYDPVYADTMKAMVRTGNQDAIVQNKAAFLSLWIRLGLSHPLSYLHAYTDLMGAYLYPDIPVKVAEIEGVHDNDLGIFHTPLIRGAVLVKIRELLIKLIYFLPLYGLCGSIGLYPWMLAIAACAIATKKEGRAFFTVLLPPVAVLLTLLIASPISSEFRYIYPLVFSAPLWLTAPVVQRR